MKLCRSLSYQQEMACEMFQNLQRRKFFVCVNLVFTKGVRLTALEIVEMGILFIPGVGAVQNCNSAKMSCIILLLLYQCPSQAASGVRSSFLCAPSNSWLPKGCEGVLLCVMWVLISSNLNRCERNLIASTSIQPLEQRQPAAPMFSTCMQTGSLGAEGVSRVCYSLIYLFCKGLTLCLVINVTYTEIYDYKIR